MQMQLYVGAMSSSDSPIGSWGLPNWLYLESQRGGLLSQVGNNSCDSELAKADGTRTPYGSCLLLLPVYSS